MAFDVQTESIGLLVWIDDQWDRSTYLKVDRYGLERGLSDGIMHGLVNHLREQRLIRVTRSTFGGELPDVELTSQGVLVLEQLRSQDPDDPEPFGFRP